MIRKFLFNLILLCGVVFTSHAKADYVLNLGPLKVKELEQIYQFYDYKGERGYLMIPGYHYPPIILSVFPSDFNSISDEETRNALFIKIMAPLALKINEEILAERQQISDMFESFKKNKDLTPEQSRFIEEKAEKYDIFSRLKGYQRNLYLLKELMVRVDALPPSFLIAVSAMETNWGTSRIVKEGNALYKTLEWHTDKGLKPIGETEDDSYRIKTYPDLHSSMQEYALKLNSQVPYADMRNFRRQLRFRDSVLRGTTFAYTLLWNSPLKNYAGMLEYTIAFYELNIIDKSLLNSKMIDKPLPKDF